MGSCFGCFSNKPKNENKTKTKKIISKSSKTKPKESQLSIASRRLKTVSGVPVVDDVKTRLIPRKILDEIKNDPEIGLKARIISNPPYSEFTQISEHLFITGFWGLSKENIEENHIKCIISTVYELPKFQIKGIECIRLPVSIHSVLL